MKIVLSLFFAFIGVYFLFLSPVQAHILKTDGNIGAVLHINPDDDPIAGEQTSFFFEFKDKTDKFKFEDCDCNFFIVNQGKEIFSQPMNSESVTYAFPQKGIYQVKITGKSRNVDNNFDFNLFYDVRVSKESNNTSSQTSDNWFSTHLIHLVGGGVVLVVLIMTIIKEKNKRR